MLAYINTSTIWRYMDPSWDMENPFLLDHIFGNWSSISTILSKNNPTGFFLVASGSWVTTSMVVLIHSLRRFHENTNVAKRQKEHRSCLFRGPASSRFQLSYVDDQLIDGQYYLFFAWFRSVVNRWRLFEVRIAEHARNLNFWVTWILDPSLKATEVEL